MEFFNTDQGSSEIYRISKVFKYSTSISEVYAV